MNRNIKTAYFSKLQTPFKFKSYGPALGDWSYMLCRKISFAILLSCMGIATTTAQTPVTPPPAYQPTIKLNYVREWTPSAPISDASVVPSRPVEEVKTATAYVDGLGRPLQSVSKQASPNKRDLVSATVYDALGRETYKYLPFVSAITPGGTENTNNGSFKLNPFQQQQIFMNAQYGAQGETFFYGQTDYEASPLNRRVKAFAPGNSWVGSRGSTTTTEKSIQLQYLFNTTTDAVKIFTIAAAPGSLPASVANYNQGELLKNVSIDERGKKVAEFKDKEGNVILKKVQADNTVTDGHTGWLCTYYVYDDFGQLRFVIPPKATVSYLGGTPISSFADELCFRYEYDYRHRMILKKVPGAAEVWMVYDAKDRLVMMQDGNLRSSGKWLVTVYDVLNRPKQTGLLMDGTTTFASHQINADAISGNNNYPSTALNFELLTENYYDDYSWVAGSGTTLNPTIDATNLTNSNYFITTFNASPLFALPLTANYAIKGMPTGSKVKVLGTTGQYLFTVLFYDEKGQPIQTQTINASGGKDITTTQFDFSGKPLRSLLQHTKVTPPSGGAGGGTQTHTILTKMEYDHFGRVLYARKQITSTVNGQTISSSEKTILQNSYDELGQLKTKKIGNKPNSTAELETLSYDYNIRGWLLGVNRDYLKGVVPPSGGGGGYFGFELAYDKTAGSIPGKTYAAAQFNGNIAGTEWKSKGDGVNRQYDFTYDNVNRLLKADFKQVNPDNSWDNSIVNYDVKMGDGLDYKKAYDENGNILRMQQYGLKINASEKIDDLNYTYYNGGNKLKSVIDFNNVAATKLGDFRTSANHIQYASKSVITSDAAFNASGNAIVDYGYDVNGNLITDRNKDLNGSVGVDQASGGAITYNHLNLPQVITVAGKGLITYTYDAAGNKLQKTTTEYGATVIYQGSPVSTTVSTTTDYVGGFIYESKNYDVVAVNNAMGYTNKLQFAGHEEGRIRAIYNNTALPNSITGFVFDYMVKDHLGNVRMVLTEEQQQDKYPVASLEDTKLSTEQGYYDINPNYIRKTDINPLPGLPTYTNNYNGIGNNPTDAAFEQANSKNLYRINGNENKTGLGITLKVMAGDKVNIFGNSYYSSAVVNNAPCPGCALSALNLITNFLNAPNAAATSAAHGAVTPSTVEAQSGANITGILQNAQNNQAATYNNRPRAFINYIIFDEQFKYTGGGTSIVGAAGAFTKHQNDPQLQDIVIPKNGYIYVYCSNESNTDVFFDNLQVVHSRGAILEETHYYPFGLTMAGISSKAAGKLENKIKYNGMELQGKEFSDGMGLEMYEYKYRFYDHQIGRFISQDRLADKYNYYSPYQFAGNEVPNAIDLDGLEPYCPNFALEIKLARESPGGEQAYLDQKRKEGIGTAFVAFAIYGIFNPAAGIPMAVSFLSGLPVTPAPTSVASSVVTEAETTVGTGTVRNTASTAGSGTATAAASETVSLTDKARVLTAGGEIGMMDGAANLSVNAKSGYFNMTIKNGSETGVLSGEIKIVDNKIQFGDVTVRNLESSSIVGAIDKQGSIGVATFNKLQKEMTELTKAGGYDKATIEFSKLRPDGSPLPDMPSRTIPLFDNTTKH